MGAALKQTGRNTHREREIILAYLCKFVELVKWPGDLEKEKLEPTSSIAILGDRAFNHYLAERTSGQFINAGDNARGISIPEGCYVLFIGSKAAADLSSILAQVKGKPVLTVSDIKGFASKGGMIEIVRVTNGGKAYLKLRVNTKNAEACNLTLGKELLLVADHAEEKELMIITDHLH
jgi:hypothetical protein